MRKRRMSVERRLAVFGCLAIALASGLVSQGADLEKPHGLRFLSPAADSIEGWKRESLPVGCGCVGANVFGIVGDERVQITHNAFLNPQAKGSLRWPA